MIFWTCMTSLLLGWILIGGLVVAVLFAAHWLVALLALAAAVALTWPNVRGRRR